MNLKPNEQTKLIGYDEIFNNLIEIFKNKKFPNKILLSGNKGIGKSTFAYHMINYILSRNEKHSYDLSKKEIIKDNRSYSLVINNSHPNFYSVNLKNEKKNIEISQIREMIKFINKSSFNNDYRIILIDNAESLNLSSSNSLLKVIEEPNDRVIFFLIHDSSKKLIDTIRSRCIEFKLFIKNKTISEIVNELTNKDIYNNISNDFKNYYKSPNYYIQFYNFCEKNKINYKEIKVKDFFDFILNNNIHKKDEYIKKNIPKFIEIFFSIMIKKNSNKNEIYNNYKYFINKMNLSEKFNLDFESFLIEFEKKILNG